MEGLQGARILVVDDDSVCRNLARFQLQRAGCEVVVAGDGQEAWELLQHGTFDCLVTDEQMPRLSGHELCRLIHADARLADMPIVMVTSKCLEIDAALLLKELGVVRVLPKPYSPRELLSTIGDCLGR